MELNEEIETTADDLFEFDKVVTTKKKYHEDLTHPNQSTLNDTHGVQE